jgi:hypothetical protein
MNKVTARVAGAAIGFGILAASLLGTAIGTAHADMDPKGPNKFTPDSRTYASWYGDGEAAQLAHSSMIAP